MCNNNVRDILDHAHSSVNARRYARRKVCHSPRPCAESSVVIGRTQRISNNNDKNKIYFPITYFPPAAATTASIPPPPSESPPPYPASLASPSSASSARTPPFHDLYETHSPSTIRTGPPPRPPYGPAPLPRPSPPLPPPPFVAVGTTSAPKAARRWPRRSLPSTP